jgi:general secretion pathway protein F
MPRYSFEAIASSGTTLRGSLEASSQSAALEQLVASGRTPVSLRLMSEKRGAVERVAAMLGFGGFDYLSVLHELAVLLRAGMPVERALATLRNIAPGDRQSIRLGQILDRVRGGEPLSQAFGALAYEAPPHVARLMAAGEASGRLADIVTQLASNWARAKALRDKVISSLTYPAVLVVAMAAVLWIVFTSVLPTLTPMFEEAGASLPFAAALLLAVEGFISSYGWLLLLAGFAAVAAIVLLLRREDSRLAIDRILLRSKLTLGLPRMYEAARFTRNLQTLLDGGLSLERALAVTRDGSSNSWFRVRLTQVQLRVSEGERLKNALTEAAIFPPLVIEFAAVGEESGRLGPMMGEVAAIMDHDVETQLERLTSLIAPLATLVLGGLVAAIMAGVVSGILAVNELAR